MKAYFSLLVLACHVSVNGQILCDEVIQRASFHGNDVRSHYTNVGSVFMDPGSNPTFYPYSNEPNEWDGLRGVTSLWLAAKNQAGGIIDAGADFPLPEFGDFCPGPLDVGGNASNETCVAWNRIWQAFRDEILHHMADFEYDGKVDTVIPNIYAWPGNGNPFFEQFNGITLPMSPHGYAPFFDKNSNGIYEPHLGEYPSVPGTTQVPSQLLWSVSNDDCGGLYDHLSGLNPSLHAEIQLTSFSFYCDENPLLNRTLFNQWKIINKSNSTWDSLLMGLFSRWSFGCPSYGNSGVGTYAAGQSVFHYQRSVSNPGNSVCDSILPDSILNTLVSTTFLSHELFRTNVVGLPCTPFQMENRLFEILTGQTANGLLTQGGDGCNPAAPPAQFAFDGNPADPDGWSMASANLPWEQYRIIPSIFLGSLAPDQSVLITTATTIHRQAGLDFAQNVQRMYDDIDSLRSFHQNGIATACHRKDCLGDCVWPGDTNGDFIVNHCDLLPLGVHLNESGPNRGESPFWHATEASPWNNQQANGKNLKHADADGDGLIEIEDFHISENNYLFTVPGYTPPATVYQQGPELYFTTIGLGQSVDPDHLKAGQDFAVRIWLDGPDDLYGLTFQVEYDTAYLVAPQVFGQGLRYFDQRASYITDYRKEGHRFVFDLAWVRTHPDSSLADGKLYTFFTGTHDSYPNQLPSANTLIRLRNIKGILNDGTEISLGSTDLELHIDDITTGVSSPAGVDDPSIFPNPADEYFHVSFTNDSAGRVEMKILNLFGQSMLNLFLEPGDNELEISTVDFPPGCYVLNIGGRAVKKILILH